MYEHLISEALKRREIFNNLNVYLKKLKEVVVKVDSKAEVYIFGSIAEDRYNYSSDVDVLIVTEKDKLKMLKALTKEEFTKVFEVYIRKPKDIAWYKKMTKLVRI
jgi:predicted nucleotidyltransferase